MMTQSATPTILLVEDDPHIADAIAHAVTEGLPPPAPRLVVRPSASLAWGWLSQNPPPVLVVIDQYLAAGERGGELACQLRDDPRLTVVPRIGYSQLTMPAAELFSACLIKDECHAALLAQIVRLLRGAS